MALRPSRLLPDRYRLPALLLAGVIVIAAGVWTTSYVQREAATRVARQAHDAQSMLVAVLDQETGLRGYLLTARPGFLAPYTVGRRDFDAAISSARVGADGDRAMVGTIDAAEDLERSWQGLAEGAVALVGQHGVRRISISAALQRKALIDRVRAMEKRFERMVEVRRSQQLRGAGRSAVGVSLVLGLVFGAFGSLLIRRGRRERERDHAFAESLQLMRSEGEAHRLLRDYVEREVHGSRVTVLTRNNSADRLEASTGLADGDPLQGPLDGAVPDSCLAVRLARPYSRAAGATPLLSCDLCGKSAGGSLCQPLLVGGEVLGSILLRKASAPTTSEGERLAHSVSRAAPALANLRNLAIAEARAHTDPLTSLPNKRSIQDNVHRLHAHAARTDSPLSVLVVDLDHFKRINDTYGHERGDQALAAAAEALSGGVRRSDFVGRMGGEEFIVLLPDTNADAAESVAENLRVGIRALRLPGMHEGMSASFGVATFPDDATESDALMRLADRALYIAKKQGRDRVERAVTASVAGGVTTSSA